MKPKMFLIVFTILSIIITLFFPPTFKSLISINLVIVAILFTVVNLLPFRIRREVYTANTGIYLFLLCTYNYRNAIFIIMMFSFMSIILLHFRKIFKNVNIDLVKGANTLGIKYLAGFTSGIIITIYFYKLPLYISFILIFFTFELIFTILKSLYSISSKEIKSTNIMLKIKDLILRDTFQAIAFYPLIYFSINNYNNLLWLCIIIISIIHIMIHFIFKYHSEKENYFNLLIYINKRIDEISSKGENIDFNKTVINYIKHLISNRHMKFEQNKIPVTKKDVYNKWNIILENSYLSLINLSDPINTRLQIRTETPLKTNMINLIDLLIQQILMVSHNIHIDKRVQHDFYAILEALINIIDAKDPYSSGHSKRVSYYAYNLAKEIMPEKAEKVRLSALLHDIGKIRIPTEILIKKEPLTNKEYNIIKKHPTYGFEMLINLKGLDKDILDGILYHHERLDGSGYPYAIKGNDIPEIAKIICIIDIFDAMTSDRPYRQKMSNDECFEILMKSAENNMIDKNITETFIKSIS